MKIFEIKHCTELTWDDIPYVEDPVFAHLHIMDTLNDPKQLWMHIQNLHQFIEKEIGVYNPLKNHDYTNNCIKELFGSGHYFNVSRTDKPFSSAFTWHDDEAHPHKGFWIDRSNVYWRASAMVKNYLTHIANEWHRLQTLEFTQSLLQSPYEVAQEKVGEYFSVVSKKSKPVTAKSDPTKNSNLSTNDKLHRLMTLSAGLKVGSKGDDVIALQRELGFTGSDLDGKYGGKTNSALKGKISGLREYDENIKLLEDPKITSFLSILSFKESGNRYDVITGGNKFTDFSRHPNVKVWFEKADGSKYPSTASGAYQFTYETWKEFGLSKGASDFSPRSQDFAALNLLRHLNVISELQGGNLDKAIFNAGKRWDAFPLNKSGLSISGGNRPLQPIKDLYSAELKIRNAKK